MLTPSIFVEGFLLVAISLQAQVSPSTTETAPGQTGPTQPTVINAGAAAQIHAGSLIVNPPPGTSSPAGFLATLASTVTNPATVIALFAGLTALLVSRSAETRQKAQAIVQAAEVLNQSSDDLRDSVDHGSVLFCLIRLGERRLALNLLHELWQDNRISCSSATWVINEILRRKVRWWSTLWWRMSDLQNERDYAASALYHSAEKLPMANGGYEWPSHLEWSWDRTLTPFAKRTCLNAIAKMLTSRPRSDWTEHSLSGVLETVDTARRTDRNPEIRCRVSRLELAIVSAWPSRHVPFESGPIEVDSLKTAITTGLAKDACRLKHALPASFDEHIHSVDEWVLGKCTRAERPVPATFWAKGT